MKLQRFNLDAGSLGGLISILRPVPSEWRDGDTLIVDPWGVLAPLREAPDFAALIPIVDGEAFSDALHGRMRPLMDQIGPEPKNQLARIRAPFNECARATSCFMFDIRRCYPTRKKLPECWSPKGGEGLVQRALAIVTLTWAEGRYVVVVEGAEFVVGRVV